MLKDFLELSDIMILNKNQQLSIHGGGNQGCHDPDVGGGCHTSK